MLSEGGVMVMEANAPAPTVRRLGYVCGAARVSTRADAESSGPRAHVVGVISAFRTLGWDVQEYIVGDLLPRRLVGRGSRDLVERGRLRRLAGDLARISMGKVNARRAFEQLHQQVDWVYERFGAFQALGRRFQARGIPWILETQSPLFQEAHGVRQSIMLVDLEKRMEIAAYRDCDVLVCVTEALRDIMVKELGIASEKIVVVPNGVDTTRFDPRRITPRRFSNDFTVGFVGSLYSWVGLDVLLRSVARLRAEKCAVAVTVVGDGRERGALERLADSLQLRDHVFFTGGVPWEEVPNHIAGFDMCYSGQVPVAGVGAMYHSPLKLYEYMAMERPVVASAFEDATVLIEHGRNGFLFEAGNVADLSGILYEALTQRERLAAIGRAARTTILGSHSWTHRVSVLIESVNDILARSRPSYRTESLRVR